MKENGGKGGFKGIVVTGIMLVLIAAGLTSIVKSNNINSPSELFAYFKSYSDKIWECSDEGLEWNCDVPFSGDNGSGSKGSENKSTGEATSKETVDVSLDKLESIKIAEPQDVEYERSEWKHWTGSPCNTREEVLKEQGTDVKTDDQCRALSGTWYDVYSGETFTDSGKLDIDHVIALGYAAKHGGQEWSAAEKEKFANDKTQLLAVSAGENRSKSDAGPGEYMPSNKDYHCDYSKLWVDTASKYSLTISEKDKKALEKGLSTCDA